MGPKVAEGQRTRNCYVWGLWRFCQHWQIPRWLLDLQPTYQYLEKASHFRRWAWTSFELLFTFQRSHQIDNNVRRRYWSEGQIQRCVVSELADQNLESNRASTEPFSALGKNLPLQWVCLPLFVGLRRWESQLYWPRWPMDFQCRNQIMEGA